MTLKCEVPGCTHTDDLVLHCKGCKTPNLTLRLKDQIELIVECPNCLWEITRMHIQLGH